MSKNDPTSSGRHPGSEENPSSVPKWREEAIRPVFIETTADHEALTSIYTDVMSCSSCGNTHRGMTFTKLPSPENGYTHWAKCPVTRRTILLKEEDEDAVFLVHVEAEGLPETNPHDLKNLPAYEKAEGLRGGTWEGPPVVVCAALRVNGLVYSAPRPARHHHLTTALLFEFGTVAFKKLCEKGREDGFLLSDGTFVDRKRAAEVALHAGQVEQAGDRRWVTIYSEDLW